jgi:hypothetical protein
MAISEYWVGEIPIEPIRINLIDSDNDSISMNQFSATAHVIDPDDEEVDITGSVLTTSVTDGQVVFRWPLDRSLFTKTGYYQLQIWLTGNVGGLDKSEPLTIIVRKFGGNN